ncbi:MAG: Gfo/Idh/MocA family oxidoreductase [Chloroflexota bacterium]
MQQKQLQIGVIGTGDMGGRHIRNFTSEVAAAQVVAVMDIDQARLQTIAQECDVPHTFTRSSELINHPDVAAVLIATPDRFHAETAHACIQAGKPVLCEKPLATSAAEAYKVIEAEVAHGNRLVQLGFMREYDPAHQKVKQVSQSGELGKTLAFRGVHINPTKGQLRTIQDVVTNSAIHDIHSARWMMADEVDTVYTSYIPGASTKPNSARLVLIQLQFRKGGLGHIECNSESGYGYEVDVRMTGEMGNVHTNSLESAVVSHGGNRSQQIDEDWLQRFDAAYLQEGRAWVQSILDGTPTGPTAWDGYVSMLVADACVESAKSGVAVKVDVPKMPALYRRS